MKTLSSPPAARSDPRAFRADRVPVPPGPEHLEIRAQIRRAVAAGTPVDLEIGCGVGWHPIRYARENPERLLVAIERTTEKFKKFRDRLDRNAPLPNLIPVHADAAAWVTHFADLETFERIFILYPNPNPKNPSARWIRMPFFGHLLTKLRSGGSLELRTNIATYALEFQAEAGAWGLEHVKTRELRGPIDAEDARTHFERKYLERGETCFVSEWRSIPGTLR